MSHPPTHTAAPVNPDPRRSPQPMETRQDIARVLGCHVRSVDRYEDAGIIPRSTRFGTLRRWPPGTCAALLAQAEANATPPRD